MIIGELLVEFLAQIFLGIIWELIVGLYKLIKKGIYKLFGIKERLTEIEKIEKRFLYKEFKLRKSINPEIKRGMKGVVLEIIDKKNMYAEFRNENNELIEYNNENTFKIRIVYAKLIKKVEWID